MFYKHFATFRGVDGSLIYKSTGNIIQLHDLFKMKLFSKQILHGALGFLGSGDSVTQVTIDVGQIYLNNEVIGCDQGRRPRGDVPPKIWGGGRPMRCSPQYFEK